MVKLIVHAAGDAVTQELLVLGHHPGAHLLADQAPVVIFVILHSPGGRHTQPSVRITYLQGYIVFFLQIFLNFIRCTRGSSEIPILSLATSLNEFE